MKKYEGFGFCKSRRCLAKSLDILSGSDFYLSAIAEFTFKQSDLTNCLSTICFARERINLQLIKFTVFKKRIEASFAIANDLNLTIFFLIVYFY